MKKIKFISQGILVHSYPHSWRSKAPLVYKNTSQWFISMDTNDLRIKHLRLLMKLIFSQNKDKKD